MSALCHHGREIRLCHRCEVENLEGKIRELRADYDRDMAKQGMDHFQARAIAWMRACFIRPDSTSQEQRSFRFLEEALELAQAAGTRREDALRLVEYVYGRPIGEVSQEVGGVMVTLAGLAQSSGLDVSACAAAEIARCERNTEKIRAKDLAKPERSPLPGGAVMEPP